MDAGTIVNRSVLLVRAKEPLRAWVAKVFAPDPPPSLAEMNTDCSAYLVPQTEEDDENRAILRIAFPTLFEYALAEWCTDPDTWPDIRDRAVFNEWIHCEFHTVVTDLAPGLIVPWET